MKRLSRVLAACALAVLVAGCDSLPAVFEDVGLDNPHPPAVGAIGIGVLPAGWDDPEKPTPVAFLPPDAVVTVGPGPTTIGLALSWTDAGGDIARFTIRDRDGDISGSAEPADTDFFPGTAGTIIVAGEITGGQQGPHRLEVWAEDSRDSRSQKLEFTVNVVLF